MTDVSRSRNACRRSVEPTVSSARYAGPSLTRRIHASHLVSCLFWAVWSSGCDGTEVLRSVPVQSNPDDDADAAANQQREPGTCAMTPAYLSARKACAIDADCELAPYRTSCCAPTLMLGIAISSLTQVRDCAEAVSANCKTPCSTKPTRAEDGRSARDRDVFDDIVPRCVDGQCRSVVATRHCGSALICKASELCVASGNVGGVAAPGSSSTDPLTSYVCMANPCPQRLDCTCAQTLCDARTDALRQCQFEFSSEADLNCEPVRE